jgi:predicted ATP-grasp superfamily ATP-dependent carboligase
MSPEEIKLLLFQLPVEELLKLAEAIEERIKTFEMMRLAETSFREWNDKEEDIYNVEA